MRNTKKLVLTALMLFGFMILSGCNDNDTIHVVQPATKDTITIKQDGTFVALDKERVYEMITNAKIKHPKIVLQQAILETGHFTSNYCTQYNNLFGFMTSNGCKKFESYEDCVWYYKRWQDQYYRSYEYNTYYDFLDSIGYAEDTNYVETLVKINTDV